MKRRPLSWIQAMGAANLSDRAQAAATRRAASAALAAAMTVLMALTASLALVAQAMAPADAADYFPLEKGNRWTYRMSSGMEMTIQVTGFEDIGGVNCAALETTMGLQKNVEYLAADAEGLKAYKMESGGQELLYDAPILRLKLPYRQGDSWTASVDQGGVTVQTAYVSTGEESIRTPAGDFEAVAVRGTITTSAGAQMVATNWYAEGVGLIRQAIEIPFQQPLTADLTETSVKPRATGAGAAAPAVTPPVEAAGKPGGTVGEAMRGLAGGIVGGAGAPPAPQAPAAPQAAQAPASGERFCPTCMARLQPSSKFCDRCGSKVPPPAAAPAPSPGPALTPAQAPPPAPVLQRPTACPKCKGALGPTVKFCPECGWKVEGVAAAPAAPRAAAGAAALPMPAGGAPPALEGAPPIEEVGPRLPPSEGPSEPVVGARPPPGSIPDLEEYRSPDGKMKLYRPKGWKVEPGEISGEGTYKVSVLEPEENALVLFATFPVSAEIKDSVALAAVVLEDMKSEFEKLEVLQVSSSPERDRTLARVALTYEGKDGVGHAYFFQTERLGTMYLLLARDGWWEKVQPLLTNVAANIAYAPEGVETVIEKGRKLAEGTGAAASGASPAAIIQEAAKRPGKALQLQEAALPDGSMSIALPRGWILEGQGLQFVLADEPRARLRGVCSVRHTVIPGIQVPGGISSPYLPPPQALSTIVEAGAVGTGLEVLGECPAEGILPESTASAQFLRSQGYQVDSRILHVRFKSKVTGARLRGMFTVDCSTQAMAVVWSCMFTGGWAPEAEFDEYFPLFLRMTKSVRVNEAWMGQEMARRSARQAQLNRNLQNSIAEASKAFDGYMDSLQNSSRSRDYQAWVRSQTTLGQGTWVAENEGARVYQTDSWGIQGPEGRVDSPAYNTTYFTGESPWGDRLEQVDTRAEYEKYIEGR